jgi:hypothetical protein
MSDIELDWRERPMLSPLGGFLIQSRAGHSGSFEVVIAWPDGGLAHFWRENDNDVFKWHGPTRFGDGAYIGATVIESDFRFMADAGFGNLEVLATHTDGTVDHYWRENGGHFLWKGPFRVFDGAGGSPSMAYSGAPFSQANPLAHLSSHFYVVAPIKGTGFSYWVRHNWETGVIEWKNLGGTGSVTLVGVGFAITTINHGFVDSGYKWLGIGGDQIVVGTAPHLGWLPIYVNFHDITKLPGDNWRDQTMFGRDVFPDLQGEFWGRPCLIQGDYGYKALSDLPFSGDGHLGNLELVVPSKSGGLIHFWRDSGIPRARRKSIGTGWQGPIRIPGPVYDEVSLIQSNFGGEHGNLEMIARKLTQRGFDFFWRDEKLVWHGPSPVGQSPPPTGTTTQPLTQADILVSLRQIGIDFSVPEADLREWLSNPTFTPYPAIAGTLLNMLEGKSLRKPVSLDVIVFNYEHAPGAVSPRKLTDVDPALLMAAVLEGYNTRNGESEASFHNLVR